MAGFSVALVVAAALFGAAVRARLHFVSPLPSDDPFLWLLLGALQDIAVMGIAAAIVSWLSGFSKRLEKPAAIFLAVLFEILCLSSFLWSEALAYFGHPPRPGDLGVAATGSIVSLSVDRGAIVRLILALVVSSLLLLAAWVVRRRIARGSPARLLAISAAALLLCALPVPIHLRATAYNPVFFFAAPGRERPGTAPPAGFRRLETSGSPARFPSFEPTGPRSSAAPSLPPGTKPNVVFLLLEGVRSNELGAWGGPYPDLSPRLDDLARRGIRVVRAYSPGTKTPEGELGLWYGLFATPQTLVLTYRPDVPRDGLPERLRAAGWRSLLWVFDGEQTFYQRDRFYRARGFRMIDGRDFPPTDPRTNWGYSDRSLARHGLEALDRLEEPFAAMLLTVSNHHPFQVPADAKTTFDIPASSRAGFVPFGLGKMLGLHTVPMLKTIHYTDEAVGAFMDGASSKPWFGRTVFVFCGDHGLPIAPLSGSPTPHQYSELRHRVPLIFFSPLLKGGKTIEGPASVADVPSTLLGLAGLPGPAGAGRDLLDPASEDPDRPVIAWNEEGQIVTIATRRFVYHATVATDRDGGISLSEEILVAAEDKEGKENLASKEEKTIEVMRTTAKQYVSGYFPSLLTSPR